MAPSALTTAGKAAHTRWLVARPLAKQAASAQAGADDANRLPPELMRRYEVLVRPRQKHKAIKLRDVSAAHIGKLVRVQARLLPSTVFLRIKAFVAHPR